MSRKGQNFGKIAPDKGLVTKARVVGSRISGEQADKLKALADESNMTESTYIRHVIQRSIQEGWTFKIAMFTEIAKQDDSSVKIKPRGP